MYYLLRICFDSMLNHYQLKTNKSRLKKICRQKYNIYKNITSCIHFCLYLKKKIYIYINVPFAIKNLSFLNTMTITVNLSYI